MTLFEYFRGLLIEKSYKRRVNEAHYILLLNYNFKANTQGFWGFGALS